MHIETKQLEGRRHYVVPVVMLLTGVYSGSKGPLLYLADDLRASVPLWNGRPAVVFHPSMADGGAAGNPDVFTRQRIGTIFNTQFDGRRLTAQAWIDEARVAEVDPRVKRAIATREMLECSTGLFVDEDEATGVFNGREYRAVARRHRPDHLAILPDQTGACSIADGAGFIRNQVHVLEQALGAPAWSW
jgi:hypothetical protein